MSRVGLNPVAVPDGVNVELSGQDFIVKGKLGELSMTLMNEVEAKIKENQIILPATQRFDPRPQDVGHGTEPGRQHGHRGLRGLRP